MATQLSFAGIATAQIAITGPDGAISRTTRNPGDDLSDLPTEIQAAISAHWTAERVTEWRDWAEQTVDGER